MNEKYIKQLLKRCQQAYTAYHASQPIHRYTGKSDYEHPRLLINPKESVSIRVHNLPSWAGDPQPNSTPIYPHYHQFFEFVYVYQGNFYNAVNEDPFTLDSSQLLLIMPDKVHAPFTKYDTDIVINFLINPKIIESHLYQLIPTDNVMFEFFFNYLYNAQTKCSHLLLPVNWKIESILESIIQEYCDQDFLYQQSLEFQVCNLFTELARSYHTKEQRKEPKSASFPLEEILEYIQEHYATVTLDDLSQQFFYSTAYISKMLKTGTGKNFNEILLEFRLHNACYLLKNTSLTIKEINNNLGFQDSSYLGKLFLKQFNMTPSQYRLMNKQMNLC